MTTNLSRFDQLWCLNLGSGDILTHRRWRDYYNIDTDTPELGVFSEGTLIGILVDMERGFINFYKDTHDMGQAFINSELKYGDLHPFIQTQCKCKISIFHPKVYPAFREPVESEAEAFSYIVSDDPVAD
jgi:hypothetical protein